MLADSRSRKLIITVLAFLFVLAGCNSGETLAKRSLETDVEPYSADISDQEVNKFLTSVRKVDGAVEAKYQMARHFQKRNKHKVALIELRDIIQIDPTFVKAYNAMGFSYDCLGDFKKAIGSYKLALKINPNLDYVYNNLGFSYLLSHNYDAAIDAFQKAIALNDRSIRYRNNLGYVYAKKGQYDLAIVQFRKTGDEFSANQRLSKILHREGKYQMALLYSEKAHHAKISSQIMSSVMASQKEKDAHTGLRAEEESVAAQSPAMMSSAQRFPPTDIERKPAAVTTSALTGSDSEKIGDDAQIDKTGPVINSKSITEDPESTTNHPGSASNRDESMPLAGNDERQGDHVMVEVEIVLANGNGVDGMAGRLGRYLWQKGFKVTQLQNANSFHHESTKIFYYNGQRQHVLKLLGEMPLELNPQSIIDFKQSGHHIKILLGKDMIPYDTVISEAPSIKQPS